MEPVFFGHLSFPGPLNTETNVTTQTNMLHVRKMALVDPRLLKSLNENTTQQPPVDKILHDLNAEMPSILGSDADVSEGTFVQPGVNTLQRDDENARTRLNKHQS